MKKTKAQEITLAEFVQATREWPTVRQICEDYGVNERWVRSQIEHGHVRCIRLSYGYRVDPESWEAFIRSRIKP